MKKGTDNRIWFKNRKDPLNGYKMTVDSWKPDGKSAHQKTAIIEDLMAALKYVRTRRKLAYPPSYKYWKHKSYFDEKKIKELKAQLAAKRNPFSQELKAAKEEVRVLKRQLRSKIHKASVAGQRAEIRKEVNRRAADKYREYRKRISTRDKEIARLKEKLAKTEAESKELLKANKSAESKIRRLQTSLDNWKKKKPTVVYRSRTVEKPIPAEVKAAMRYLDKPLDKRLKNAEKATILMSKFLAKRKVSANHMSLLLQLKEKGSSRLSELDGVSRHDFESPSKNGLINSVFKDKVKYWYLTLEGEELVKDYLNYISHGSI